MILVVTEDLSRISTLSGLIGKFYFLVILWWQKLRVFAVSKFLSADTIFVINREAGRFIKNETIFWDELLGKNQLAKEDKIRKAINLLNSPTEISRFSAFFQSSLMSKTWLHFTI